MPISIDTLEASRVAYERQCDAAYLSYADMYDGSPEAEAVWCVTRSLWFSARRTKDAINGMAKQRRERRTTCN